MRKPTTTIGWPQYQVVDLQEPSYEDKMVAAHKEGVRCAKDGTSEAVAMWAAGNTYAKRHDEHTAFVAGYQGELRREIERQQRRAK